MFIDTLNPIFWQTEFFSIRWYGVFLTIGIALSLWILARLFSKEGMKKELAIDLSLWLIVGGVVGARLGHVFFYEWPYYAANPMEILFINHGGLASHGMALGLLAAFFLFTRKHEVPWKKIADLVVIPIPLLTVFIRLGNFFNSEILGRPTNVPWGVSYPRAETVPVPRHPVQVYEMLMGLAIFAVVFFMYKKYGKKFPSLFPMHFFFLFYFTSRFLVEFTKDEGIIAGFPLTIGQLLSIPFILWAAGWFVWKRKEFIGGSW